ncbi:C-terminal binding protein, partial [bacterium]
MLAKKSRKVAVLGARFGELNIERELLSPLGVELVEGSGKGQTETLSICKDVEAILCGGSPQIRTALIRELPRLRAIVRYGIGVDTIDLPEATRRGIYIANVPDYCIEEVATHTMALILSWTRKLPIAQRSTQSGKWDVTLLMPLQSPRDLILGLVGFGRIAQTVARMARAVGFQVCAADPYVKKKDMSKKGVKPVPLRCLIRAADFVSLHVPLSPATRHLLNAESL